MTNKIEYGELGKHPEVIKKAQTELLSMDILVCGGCHSTFHFVKEFEGHKENCTGTGGGKELPQIKENWGFNLWKSTQPNAAGQNSWKLYKTWSVLSKQQQQGWISAGQSIQSITRIGHGNVQEAQVRVVRTVPDYKVVKPEPTPTASRPGGGIKVEEAAAAVHQEASPTPLKRSIVKRTMNITGNRIEVRELAAERVTSRRLNSKRNQFEYMVKWLGNFENTWEPKSHFDKAPELLEECERKLNKNKVPAVGNPVAAAAAEVARPVRTSKARAFGQLKQWTHSEEKGAALAAELKRKITDSDYAEAEDSSQDEGVGGSPTPRKQFKASPLLSQKPVGGQVRYYQAVNGGLTTTPLMGDVRMATAADKQTGVMRKPGILSKSPVKREAQVKVVGKNETTSSGIVRLSTSPATTPTTVATLSTPTPPRMQKVIQTTRMAGGGTVKRTVFRPMPSTTTPSPPVNKVGVTRTVVQTGASRSPLQHFQAKRGIVPATPPTVPYKVSPGNTGRPVRASVAKPLGAARVMRSSPGAATAAVAAAKSPPVSDSEMTLCPVTGKLIAKGADGESDNSELERLLTDDEKQQQQDGNVSSSEQQQQLEGETTVQDTEIQQLIENEDGSPVMVTGDDGTIYQVAGKNAEGQTLLIAQGAEGEQACVFVAASEEGIADSAGGEGALGDGSGRSSGTASATSAGTEAGQDVESGEEGQAMLADQDSQDGQITAELVQADEPSADGTRRVVLLLPDGNLMVSEVNEEQYQQFNLGA